MSGFKDFADGNPLFAAEIDGYLMRQTVMRFPTTSDLLANLPSGIRQYGMLAWTDNGGAASSNSGVLWMFNGTNWVPWASPKIAATLAFTAGGTQVTVGNSTVTSEYWYSGGAVKFNWVFTIGSTANMQSGALALAIPIAADNANRAIGMAGFYDTSAANMYHRAAVTLGTTTSVAFVDTNATRWSTTSPVAFGTGDVLSCNAQYPPTAGVLL